MKFDRNYTHSDTPLCRKWTGLWSEWTTILTIKDPRDGKFVARQDCIGLRRHPDVTRHSIVPREGIFELRLTTNLLNKRRKQVVYVASTKSLYESIGMICTDRTSLSAHIASLLGSGYSIQARWLICKDAAQNEIKIHEKYSYPWNDVPCMVAQNGRYRPEMPPSYEDSVLRG